VHAPSLYKYAYFLCNNAVTADQFVGDVFERLSESLLSGRGRKVNLRSYLFEIAYHLFENDEIFIDQPVRFDREKLKAMSQKFNAMSAEDRPSTETLQWVLRNHLKDDQRHVVILRFMAGFSLKETAGIMGKTVGNVKVIQNRAMAALREALGYEGVETRAIAVLIERMAHA
jgi:RNA polymerase sigma-70 factor, ECF subfamily